MVSVTIRTAYSPDGLAAIMELKEGNRIMHYAFTDKRVSLNLLVKEDGSISADESYNAWGRPRNPVDWSNTNITYNPITDRGFTGHEHLNYFSLINMNGRMYDPTIGQFLSPDVFVQEPGNSQSFNRFSYCLNNPLKFVDPSGYLFELDNWEILRKLNGDFTYQKINDLGGEEFQILNYAQEGPNGEHYQTQPPAVFEGTTKALANSILNSGKWKNATSKPDNYDPSAAFAFCDIFEKTIFKTAVAIPTLELSSAFQFSKISVSMLSNFIADFSTQMVFKEGDLNNWNITQSLTTGVFKNPFTQSAMGSAFEITPASISDGDIFKQSVFKEKSLRIFGIETLVGGVFNYTGNQGVKNIGFNGVLQLTTETPLLYLNNMMSNSVTNQIIITTK